MRSRLKSRIQLTFKKLVNPLPARPPAYLQLEYQYSRQNMRTRESHYQNLSLQKKKTEIELVIKISSGPSEGIKPGESRHAVSQEKFERFYNRIRKWRLDLIPGPYEHRSYENYSEDWSEMLWIKYGKGDADKNMKEVEIANGREFGISGKDLQKLNLIFLLLKRFEK